MYGCFLNGQVRVCRGCDALINAEINFLNAYKEDERIVCMLTVSNQKSDRPLLEGFDLLILIMTEDKQASDATFHYIRDDMRIQERWLYARDLEGWVFNNEHRYIIQWLLEGDILLDHTGYLADLRKRLMKFDTTVKDQKLLVEFGLFLNAYLRSKEYLNQQYLLDAYSKILEALHHWARITVIESGTHPEVIVWKQVYDYNPGVYKLYDELTHSNETLEKRVQLLVLACEFTAVSKMKDCCKLIIEVLESRKGAWSMMQLMNHPNLRGLNVNLSIILKKLAAKSLIKEVRVPVQGQNMWELQYSAV